MKKIDKDFLFKYGDAYMTLSCNCGGMEYEEVMSERYSLDYDYINPILQYVKLADTLRKIVESVDENNYINFKNYKFSDEETKLIKEWVENDK